MALAGFSMGGNLVLKLAGEWGKEGPPQFRAVAAVCPAVDLGPSADALHLPSNRLYEYYFVIKLRQRLREKPGCFLVSSIFPACAKWRRSAISTTRSPPIIAGFYGCG